MRWIIALALACLSTEAAAANWKEAARSSDKTTRAWVDMDSIRKGKDSSFAWWQIRLPNGDSAKTLTSFKCGVKAYMDLQVIYYDADGKSMDLTSSLNGEWKFAAPDTVVEGVIDFICENSW